MWCVCLLTSMAFHRLSMPLSIFEVELVAVCPRCRQSTRKLTHPLFRPEGWWNHPLRPKSYSKSRMCEFCKCIIDVLYIVPFQFQTSNLMEIWLCGLHPTSTLVCINNRGCSAYWENKLKMTKWVTFWGGYLSFDASSVTWAKKLKMHRML